MARLRARDEQGFAPLVPLAICWMTVANGNHFKAENVFENLKNRYFGGPKFCVIFTVFYFLNFFARASTPCCC